MSDSPQKDAAFDEIKVYVAISPRDLNDINDRIKQTIKLLGAEFIASHYVDLVMEKDMFLLEPGGIEFDEVDNGDDINLPPDDTEKQFPKLRETVLKYVPAISTDKNYESKAKSISAFIDKNSLNVTKETVIALIDTSFFGKGSVGLLITTHAMYYAAYWGSREKIAKIVYSDIAYEKCKLEYDKKGKPISLSIAIKNDDSIIVKDYVNHDALLDMIIDIGKLSEFAPTDSPQPIAEMNYSVKLPFVKYLVNFLFHSKQTYIEAVRFACDIEFTDEQLAELKQYITGPKESDDSILLQINNNAPHGSHKSLKYALITEMYRQLCFTKGNFDENALEYEFISKTAKLYGFSSEDIRNLKILAQAEYKIITGEIKSVKEFSAVQKALTGLSFAGGVPLITIIGSSFLFMKKTFWLFFIPGIGQIIGIAVLGLVMALGFIKKNKNDADLSKKRKEMIDNEIESYESAIKRLSRLFSDMADKIKLLRKHLLRLAKK